MSEATVVNGSIRLCDWIDRPTAERVYNVAKLPKEMTADWEGQSIHLLDWKIDREKQSVFLKYQLRNDAYASILECTLPLAVERVKLTPPNKSKHWKIEEFADKWVNTKTGKRVYI